MNTLMNKYKTLCLSTVCTQARLFFLITKALSLQGMLLPPRVACPTWLPVLSSAYR